MPTPNKISYLPPVEEEGTGDNFDKSDNEDETEETSGETTTIINSITEARKKSPFSGWQPFIPSNWQGRSSQSSPAHPCGPSYSAPPCFSQEPSARTGQHPKTNWCPQISSIGSLQPKRTEELKWPSSQTYPAKADRQWRNNQSQKRKWKPCGKEQRSFNNNWSKPWPKWNTTSRRTKILPDEFPDYLGPLKQSKHWKPQSPSLTGLNQTQNTTYLNMPPETSAGNVLQPNIQFPSRIYSSMMSRLTRRKTYFLVTKSQRWSSETYTWLSKPPEHTRCLLKDSRRTPSWVWSPGQSPHTCFLNITTIRSRTTKWKRMIFPHGDHHLSKRRSESKKEGNRRGESQERNREIERLESRKKVWQQVKERQK